MSEEDLIKALKEAKIIEEELSVIEQPKEIDYSKFGFRKDYNPSDKIVKQEYITFEEKEYLVSTVDLGINHSFRDLEPLYYETMIFLKGAWVSLYCDRYTTREEASESHNKIIKAFKNKKMTLKNGYFEIEE